MGDTGLSEGRSGCSESPHRASPSLAPRLIGTPIIGRYPKEVSNGSAGRPNLAGRRGCSALPDPRLHAKVWYPSPEIRPQVLSQTTARADDFVEATPWGWAHLALLNRSYPYENSIPSHDALSDVFAVPDPELPKACFPAWVSDLCDDDPEIIAVDGKTAPRGPCQA
jgi:DDE_Tnp_1-associated